MDCADNLQIYMHSSLDEFNLHLALIGGDIRAIYDYSGENTLKININKTCSMIIIGSSWNISNLDI